MASELNFDQFSFDRISLLIQLRYYIYHHRKYTEGVFDDYVSEILEDLGISTQLVHPLYGDWDLQKEILTRLDHTIQRQQQAYEDAYGPLTLTLEPDVIKESLEQGILSLRAASMLNNPFSVMMMEKYFDLPESGNLEFLIHEWNRKFYAPSRCKAHSSIGLCFLKAIKYNDVAAFRKVYPSIQNSMLISFAAKTAARYGRKEMLETIMTNSDVDWKDQLIRYELVVYAAMSESDNREILEYLRRLGCIGAGFYEWYYTIFDEESDVKIHVNNIKYLINLPEADINIIRDNLAYIARHGWLELLQDLIVVTEPSDYILTNCIQYAIMAKNYSVVDFLRPYIEIDKYLITRLLNISSAVKNDPEFESFQYVVSLPETDTSSIEHFISSHHWEFTSSPLFDIIVESGKISREEMSDMIRSIKADEGSDEEVH